MATWASGGGSELITLNVGGSLFTTTRSTLVKHPHSMLAAMFRGNMEGGQAPRRILTYPAKRRLRLAVKAVERAEAELVVTLTAWQCALGADLATTRLQLKATHPHLRRYLRPSHGAAFTFA